MVVFGGLRACHEPGLVHLAAVGDAADGEGDAVLLPLGPHPPLGAEEGRQAVQAVGLVSGGVGGDVGEVLWWEGGCGEDEEPQAFAVGKRISALAARVRLPRVCRRRS